MEWYSSKEEAMTHFNIIRVFDSYEGVRIGSSSGNDIHISNRRITPDMLLWVPIYNPENIVVTWGDGVIEDFSDVVFIPQHKKETPLKYTELWMADTSKDTMDVMSGYLTHGKYYEVLSTLTNTFGGLTFRVVTDTGHIAPYGACWFKPVRLYDEDESELICRDIKFVEGDYIDLRKHTPEQIRHIAKFYKFWCLEGLLLSQSCCENVVRYTNKNGLIGSNRKHGKEYTYDDIFYSEEI